MATYIFNLVTPLTFLQTCAAKVSSKFCECRFMYGCLDHDIWGADWEKGWVTCWQTQALEAQIWNSPAAALQHYITTDFTVMAAAASCHRQDVMGREQLNATAVSHTAKPWTGEVHWDHAILAVLCFPKDKQAVIGWWSVQVTNATLLV